MGKTHQRKFSQKVKASFKNGLARVNLDVASADLPAAAMFASVTNKRTTLVDSTQDASILTPVLGVETGVLGYNYTTSHTDSVGNVFESYFWAPSAGTPITEAWAYRNGFLIAQYRASWDAASGGHVLAEQTLESFEADGTFAGTLVSRVEWGDPNCTTCVIEPMKNESLGSEIGTFFRLALDKVGCWLTPQVAYANMPCIWDAAKFAAETYGLYLATTSGAAFLAPKWYFVGWGMWTSGLYDLAACVDRHLDKYPRGGSRCQTNPKLCK